MSSYSIAMFVTVQLGQKNLNQIQHYFNVLYLHSQDHCLGHLSNTPLLPPDLPEFEGAKDIPICQKMSMGTLVYTDMMALRSCCRLDVGTFIVHKAHSTLSQSCFTGLWSGEYGCHSSVTGWQLKVTVGPLNSVSCSWSRSETILYMLRDMEHYPSGSMHVMKG